MQSSCLPRIPPSQANAATLSGIAPKRDGFGLINAEAAIKLVLSEKKVTDYELTARARDGKETVVSYNATTFHDRDRRLSGVFAAVA